MELYPVNAKLCIRIKLCEVDLHLRCLVRNICKYHPAQYQHCFTAQTIHKLRCDVLSVQYPNRNAQNHLNRLLPSLLVFASFEIAKTCPMPISLFRKMLYQHDGQIYIPSV